MPFQRSLTVDAANVRRMDEVVAAAVELPAGLDTNTLSIIENETGDVQPCQYVEAEGKVYFAMKGETAGDNQRHFTLRQTDRPINREQSVTLREDRAVLDVLIDDAPFAVYNYGATHRTLHRPYFYPIIGPTGRPIVQHSEFPSTLRGHYWHTGLFIAHQKVNGTSFWEEREETCGRILHVAFIDQIQGPVLARFTEQLEWRKPDETLTLSETRTVTVLHSSTARRFLDVSISLRAEDGDVTFDATPYHLLACRMPNEMCLIEQKRQYVERWGNLVDFGDRNSGGRIVNSEGQEGQETRGATARWIDFSGPLGGKWCGVSLFDHPNNPRYPTPFNNWNNMTTALSPTYHEPLVLPHREAITWNYRVYIHAGDSEQGKVEETWQAFAKPAIGNS